MHDWQEEAFKLKKQHRSVKEIARATGKTVDEVSELLGIRVRKQKEQKPTKFTTYENLSPSEHKHEWDGNTTITFGLMGDTQINSKYTQLTYLHQFYDECANRGVKDVYHTGDIDDGEQMRAGHQYECYTQGADDHVEEIVKNYPKIDGITTHFITGNHDASIYKRCGTDIGVAIASKRPDMEYLGRDCARVELTPHCILELRHPWDGTAYALSYKPQKMIDGFEADSKPNILAIGHYHKIEYLFYRNIHCFQTGCFQMQTPFTRGKGISVHLGGWIITVEVDKLGHIVKIVPEMIPFYKGIPDDYKNWR